MAQLTKAVTGVDYESGSYSSVKKRKTTDAAQATPSKVTKTTANSTPSTSKTGNPATDKAPAMAKPSQSKDDTLSSSSDSDSLPEVTFK